MSRDRLRDSRGGAEGAARASHRHEDAPDVPVRVQAGREQAADRREAAQQGEMRKKQDLNTNNKHTGCPMVSVTTLFAYFSALCEYYGISF